MEGRDSYGSGLGGRFNLIASNEDRTASTLMNMDICDLETRLENVFRKLDGEPTIIDTDESALKLLNEWWNDNSRGKPHYNRVNVIAHRKALHLAWIRGLTVLPAVIQVGSDLILAARLCQVTALQTIQHNLPILFRGSLHSRLSRLLAEAPSLTNFPVQF